MSPLLSMDDVSLSFKAKRVLNHLTFEVERGECFGFLGPSGAGKTTTIKLLTRQLVKDSGRIMLFGRAIEHAASSDYERIGILSDTSALYERMTIDENLRFYAKIRGVTGNNIPALLERMNLDADKKTLVKNCSKGMRQRAALLAALVHGPELLFLDEPTSGLDPAARAEVHKMLRELNVAPRYSSPRTIWPRPKTYASAWASLTWAVLSPAMPRRSCAYASPRTRCLCAWPTGAWCMRRKTLQAPPPWPRRWPRAPACLSIRWSRTWRKCS